MRILFMGTPEFAVDSLDSLYKSNYDLCGVVTIPDKKVGRGQKLRESAVKTYCISKGIKLLQPIDINDKVFIYNLKNFNADLFVVVAFKVLPKIIWEIPNKGTINVHASLLPQLRGAAPINWAIINGIRKTGLTSFYINEGVDTGDIIIQKEVEISENDNFGSLYNKLKKLSFTFIIDTIESIESGLKPTSQTLGDFHDNSSNSKAPKLNSANTRISWSKKGSEVVQLIRGLSPYPGAWSTIKFNNKKIIILDSQFIEKNNCDVEFGTVLVRNKDCLVQVNDGLVKILKIKVEGKKEQSGRDFVNGLHGKKTVFI
tara:strand:+ start:1964 stop:2908 length:945 start_codon:yes stop_codon:yes gene_type:complete